MTVIYLLIGLALLGVSGFLIYVGLPHSDGRIKPVAEQSMLGEFYTFAILLTLALGGAFFLNGVLG